MLGVHPEYRNRGIGQRVLLAGIAHLKDQGLRWAEITVDSENEEAYRLYRSIGFRVCRQSWWYQRAVD